MSLDNLIVECSTPIDDSETENRENADEKLSSENVDTVSSGKIFAPKITPENPVVVKSVPLGKTPMSSMEEENLRERLHVAQLKKCAEFVSQEQRYTRDTFKRLFMNKSLLEQIFYLFDREGDLCLEQEKWMEFLKQRLRDEKQIDFAEQLESVAYCLCGESPINLNQFYQIFHTRGIIDKLFRVIDHQNTGSIAAETIMEFLATITNNRPRSGFDQGSLERLEKLFRQTVGNEKEIKIEDFKKIVISKNPFFIERVFQIFDKDNSGSISLQEFLDAMHQFAGQSPEVKIRFLFKVYDLDGDGLIQHRELQHVMRACMEENGMHFSEEQIDDLTHAMFEDADTDNRGAITYEALKSQLEKHGGLLENLSISIDRWLIPPKPQPPSPSFVKRLLSLRPYQLTWPYFKNNQVYLIFLAFFVLVNAVLFITRSYQYRKSNWYTIFARACGQCLNFDCMFVLVLMLRKCITFLRTRGFSSILPLDQHIYFHKVTGMLISLLSLWHTVMHCCNFSMVVVNDPVINKNNYTISEWLFTPKPGLFGLIGGWANPTGVALVFILLLMVPCSQKFVRRGGCFEIFYWTHLMYIPFWILLLIHGPNFWKWFALPGIIYIIERLMRFYWMKYCPDRGKTYISSGLLLPSKVTHLVIKRPMNFHFHAGDYVFVNIPVIAKYEWHPFTLSSAPEQEDYMWLHIRGVGEWTNRLYEYFEKEQERLHNGDIQGVPVPTKKRNSKDSGNNNQNSLTKIRSSIMRTLSTRDKKPDVQLVGFSNDAFQEVDLGNPKVTIEITSSSPCSSTDLSANRGRRLTPEKRLQRLLMASKVPLEKSLSLPDMQKKAKNKERILALRDYMRSESEKSFDQQQMRRARMKSLGLAYLSPQNKSLAQSFRYMRNKPTIIAFKTPSLENCEQRDSSSSIGSTVPYQNEVRHLDPESQAEQGRVPFTPTLKVTPMNYPVGKPLEAQQLRRSRHGSRRQQTLYGGTVTEIFLDGPYGAPSSHIFMAQHAVLIATGIGVTPFASILQSVMHRYWKARHTCPKCKFSWASDIPASVMNLRKVDFFWINRDQRSFEWFVNLLSQLEIEQAELGGAMERFLEMHMYITSALQKTDMKAVGLQLALDLLHEKEKRDLITGLKTRTNAGRPNWDKVFKQISDQKKGKVTVFYCGPPQLARILRVKCDQYGFSFRKEVF
ncbi:NADPH oxidase 5 isoform X2 [Coccinella septempunctata]|uniref:NADPH oxidase 5 isoform X2 n=1 Tax=Coccinella septempunctata TaxID=41139 RepID=UPI001D097AA0|nr:NADPH oxidase 5 isoform X2 [Coccinella septempunctata]